MPHSVDNIVTSLAQKSIDVFPEMTAEEIHKRAAENWDFSQCVPLPKIRFVCICGNDEWQGRNWDFFDYGHTSHRVQQRCNVGLKCTHCGLTHTFGVAITEEYYRENKDNGGNWRQVKALLAQGH